MKRDGDVLSKALKANDITRKKFADLMGINRSTVYSYFSTKTFQPQIKERIKEATGIDIDSLYHGNDAQRIQELEKELEEKRIEIEERKERELWLRAQIDKLTE